MRYLSLLVLVGTIVWGGQSEAQTNPSCGNYNEIKKFLLQNHGEIPVWMGASNNESSTVILLENKKTGNWSALKLISGTDKACLIGYGNSAVHIGGKSKSSNSTAISIPTCGDEKPWKQFEDQYSDIRGAVYGTMPIDMYFEVAGYDGPIQTIYESVGYAGFEDTGAGMIAYLIDGCPIDFEITSFDYIKEILRGTTPILP